MVAVQDGLQASGTLTATTSAPISQTFVNAGSTSGAAFRATNFQVVAATSGGCFIDVTGAIGLATTSAGYQMAPGEVLRVPLSGAQPFQPGYYTGFSILGLAGVTSSVRYIALR